jgi:hypothetical protein
MTAPTQDVPGYYVWQVPGAPVIVHLRLDIVDLLAAEIMRGFGAVPKRGAEIGGVLIGAMQKGDPAVVRVEDFKSVACTYRRGPSYLFTEEDAAAFEEAFQRWQPEVSPSAYAVGFFRSHTRDGFALAAEDIELLDHFFPNPSHIALLVKPYATKVNVAAFFTREHGVFPETAQLEFPLRRRELAGEDPLPRRSLLERRPRTRNFEPLSLSEKSYRRDAEFIAGEPAGATPTTAAPPATSRIRNRWIWVLLPAMFLLLGAALGFQAALTMGSRVTANTAQEFSLSLSVTKNDDNLSVKWDRQSPAIRAAQKGVLEIEDGGYTKPVDLDQAQLQNGTLIYRNSSNSVRFRLTVYPQARVSVTETLLWKQ